MTHEPIKDDHGIIVGLRTVIEHTAKGEPATKEQLLAYELFKTLMMGGEQ